MSAPFVTVKKHTTVITTTVMHDGNKKVETVETTTYGDGGEAAEAAKSAFEKAEKQFQDIFRWLESFPKFP